MQKEQPITLPDILQEQKASQYSGGIYTRGWGCGCFSSWYRCGNYLSVHGLHCAHSFHSQDVHPFQLPSLT